VVSINGVDVQFGGAAGSSAFASKTPINSQRRVQVSMATYWMDPGVSRGGKSL
jgi:hypothetical protein